MTEQLSNCCNAPVKVRGSHETTRWFECTKCGFSCNATTDTANLAQCVCGRQAQWGSCDGKHWVTCPNYSCNALTPRFTTQALANAAWNRMVVGPETCEQFNARMEPLRKAAGIGPLMVEPYSSDARNLLSALADELQRSINLLPSSADNLTFHPTTMAICVVRDTIRTVLTKP